MVSYVQYRARCDSLHASRVCCNQPGSASVAGQSQVFKLRVAHDYIAASLVDNVDPVRAPVLHFKFAKLQKINKLNAAQCNVHVVQHLVIKPWA